MITAQQIKRSADQTPFAAGEAFDWAGGTMHIMFGGPLGVTAVWLNSDGHPEGAGIRVSQAWFRRQLRQTGQ